MKIIFDNEEQKNYLTGSLCPYDVNTDINEYWCADLMRKSYSDCNLCWERSGIEMEVRDDNNQNM